MFLWPCPAACQMTWKKRRLFLHLLKWAWPSDLLWTTEWVVRHGVPDQHTGLRGLECLNSLSCAFPFVLRRANQVWVLSIKVYPNKAPSQHTDAWASQPRPSDSQPCGLGAKLSARHILLRFYGFVTWSYCRRAIEHLQPSIPTYVPGTKWVLSKYLVNEWTSTVNALLNFKLSTELRIPRTCLLHKTLTLQWPTLPKLMWTNSWRKALSLASGGYVPLLPCVKFGKRMRK
jgi:hypothetical protein